MKNKLGQEQAFPSDYTGNSDREVGMSKRFYAACSAMQGLCASNIIGPGSFDFEGRTERYINRISKIAYQFADELLKQENL
jgi:hypothetical protein